MPGLTEAMVFTIRVVWPLFLSERYIGAYGGNTYHDSRTFAQRCAAHGWRGIFWRAKQLEPSADHYGCELEPQDVHIALGEATYRVAR